MRAAVVALVLALLAGCGTAERRPATEPATGCGPGGSFAFDALPDGPVPAVDDVGRPVVAGGTRMTATIADGALVPVGDGVDNGAYYVNTDLGAGRDGWGIRASWVWPVPDEDESLLGAMGLLLFDRAYTGTGTPPTESRLHLAFGASGRWQLAVVADSEYLEVESGEYAEPALDGETVYEASALLEPATGDLHIVFPDRTAVTVEADDIADALDGPDVRDLGGRYAVVEAFQNLASDVVPEIRSTAAYADPDDPGLRDCLARVEGEAP